MRRRFAILGVALQLNVSLVILEMFDLTPT